MDILKNLADLLKVKTLVTLMVMMVFVVMALRGDIQPDAAMNVVLIVIAFYFGTQHEKRSAAKPSTESDSAAE